MQIINRQKDALKTSLSLTDFGKAMAQLDLSSVAPEKRRQAIMDHLAKIMIGTIHDRDKAAELAAARLLHLKADK